MSEKKVNTKPVDYAALNQLSQDFETRFVPQTELSAEQVFWSQNSVNSEEPNLSTRPTQVEVPKELSKVSMVNSCLKKLKFHLASFDVTIEQHHIESNTFQDKMKEVLNENERLLEQAISKDIVNIVVTANVNNTYEPVNECERWVTLEIELQKDFIKKESLKDTLRKLKGKVVVDKAVTLHLIDPKFLKIDVAPLAPKLRNNRTVHYDYLKHTQEEITTLRELVENERLLNPLNTSLDYVLDLTLFIRRNGNGLLLVQIYVDDIIFATSTLELCDLLAKIMCSKFKMSMMGKISFFLGLQISQSPRGIFINQSKYALESLKKYGFESCDPIDTPMVEKSKLNKDKEEKAIDPSYYRGLAYRKALTCGKKIFRYLRGTVNRGLWYPKDSSIALTTFADADYAGCQDTRGSTSAEYIALSGCCAQILWMSSQLTDYGLGFNKIPIYCDNNSAIALCCNNVQHSKSKHIDIRYHFIKEHVQNGVIEPYFVNTEYQLVDLFTKALGRERIEFLINKLGVKSFTSETLKQLMNEVDETMDMTIDQQVALDEALVPHASQLRIGKSNFRLRSDINSKESTLQLVYNVLRLTLFYKAFLVTTDVPEIYMKNADFVYLLWEDIVYQVEHKEAKKSNEMYYPRFTKLIIYFFMTKDPSIPRRNKTKASVKKTKSSSNTTITPPTAAGIRLSTLAKGKQPAKSSKAKGLSMLSEVAMTKAEQIKIATKRSLQQNHISQANGSGANEETSSLPRVLDVPTNESNKEISWKLSDEDDDDDEVDDRSDDQEDDDDQDEDDQDDDDDDDQDDDDQDDNDDDQDTDNNGDDFVIPSCLSIKKKLKMRKALIPLFKHRKTLTMNSSSVSSQFVTSMLNLSPDVGIDSLFESTPRVDVQASTTVAPLILTAPTLTPPTIPTISQFAGAVSSIPEIIERYMDQRMNEAAKNIQKIIKEQVKDQVKVQVSKILPKIEKTVNEQLEAKVLTRSSNSSKKSYAMATDLSEMELKKILIEKMESNKFIHRSDEQMNLYKALIDAYKCDKIILDTYGDTVTLKRRRDDADKDEEPSVGSDRWSKRRREGKEPESTSPPKEKGDQDHCNLAKQADSCSSFIELMDTPVDFSAFLMNRLKVDTLTLELLAGPTYELMKGSCKSLYHAPDSIFRCDPFLGCYIEFIDDVIRGHHVIPFAHFINNDLEYLRGGASSQKYTTSVTKTKAEDYGHLKWIEDLVPRTMWIQEPLNYDKHALWRVSHWGRKRQQFYEFAVNRESALDVYSKRRIIAVTDLKIVEWHNYKHLD
nr:hypothetical protein [Tanacetum cinerariifolium]